MRELQYKAATTIQRVAKRKLIELRQVKNAAALKIQKNWRITCFLPLALLRKQ